MARTKFRSTQGIDQEFLTEDEGAERFIFRDGYGTNETNVVLDGYLNLVDQQTDPSITPTTGNIIVYAKSGEAYTKNPQGTVEKLGGVAVATAFTPVIKTGTTTETPVYSVGFAIENGDAVFVSINLSFSKSGTGDLTIEGLPAVAKNTANLVQGLSVVQYNGVIDGAAYGRVTSLQATLQPNSSTL